MSGGSESTGGSGGTQMGTGGNTTSTGGTNNTGGFGGIAGSGSNTTDAGGDGGSGNATNAGGSDNSGGTGGTFDAAANTGRNVYIMFDVSGSMLNDDNGNGRSRLEDVREAMDSFLLAPANVGLGAGIGYFGTFQIGQASCNPADYANAEVAIAPLPENAQAISASLQSKMPTGETPTGAALRGACTYAQGYKVDNPSQEVDILLVTDDLPEATVTCSIDGSCCPTVEDAVAAAGECFAGSTGLRTFVLAVADATVGLDQIAAAGGTNTAYFVSPTGNVTADVLNALAQIRSAQ